MQSLRELVTVSMEHAFVVCHWDRWFPGRRRACVDIRARRTAICLYKNRGYSPGLRSRVIDLVQHAGIGSLSVIPNVVRDATASFFCVRFNTHSELPE